MSQVNEEELKSTIKKIIDKYNRVRSNLIKENVLPSKKRENLWIIRADLELIIVSMKYFYKLKEHYEWQEKFKKTRGTANITKAIERLQKFNKTSTTVLKTMEKNKEQAFRYLWELKETIAKNMKAFPHAKWIRKDKKFVKQSDKIFYV